MPTLRQIVSQVPGPAPPAIPAAGGFTAVDPRLAAIYVPRPLQRRVAIELEIELTRLADPTVAAGIGLPVDLLLPGQHVYHDGNLDSPPAWFTPFEVTDAVQLGDLRLVPVAHGAGYWLIRVDAYHPE